MGRKKIQIKPITDEKIRKVTFNRRRNGILKKAYELSILCDTEVVVLMFDHKEMCHVYSSEEGANSHARLMGKYITKDFCTVDPIRNYDTSPDLQLDDPSQAVWRQSKEKVAVVNTYTVLPSTGTPHLASSKGHADDDDDDEADGSEQLAVKSSRTYHTKPSDAKFGQQMNTPALTDKAHSPTDRSVSPDLRNGQLSPRRSPAQPKRGQQQQQQPLYPAQSGLGISGSGYTPLLRPGEQFTPILYPPQPPPQARYTIWPSPEMVTDQCGMTQQLAPRQHLLPNMGIQYANQQLQSQVQYQHYDAFTEEFVPSPFVPQPLMRQSPRKEQAHFNHYTYPRPQNAQYYQPEPYDTQPLYQTQFPTTPAEGTRPVQFVHTQSGPQIADRDADEPSDANEKYLKVPTAEKPTKKTTRKVQTSDHQRNNTCKVSETADDDAEAPRLQVSSYELEEVQVPLPERRITRSQSRSPQMKARQLPARLAVPMSRKQVPVHLRGPSLIDDITFDPETGAPMMESAALADWLGSTPIHGASPGHSRETSHVRVESVSQWLNLPPAIPE